MAGVFETASGRIMPSLILPYPPSANRYWRIYNNRAVVSVEAGAYKREIWAIAHANGVSDPTLALVSLECVLRPVCPKDSAKRERREGPNWHHALRCIDVSNAIKIAEDALQGIAYVNDKQVRKIHIERGMPVEGGAFEITWGPLEETA
jgi:crossover junction endodeoxyribonuclease RusA